jgi:hypothetical protein
MADHDPQALRKVYFEAWQKEIKGQPTSPLEAMIVDIIKRHPQYHGIFSHPESFENLQNEKFPLDHNPFFHLALHVTIMEQVGANKPDGIRQIYAKLLKKHQDQTETEHKMMECLAKVLMTSFQTDSDASEQIYLESLKRLV